MDPDGASPSRPVQAGRHLRCRLHRLAAALLAAGSAAPAAAQESVFDLVPKVIVVGIDGVRPDALRDAPTPVMNTLIASGAFSERARTGVPTLSGPSWASMLTGVWRE